MSIGSVSSYRFLMSMTSLRSRAETIQDQLGTGLRSHTYGGLGAGRATSPPTSTM